jgi:hypothetical protein
MPITNSPSLFPKNSTKNGIVGVNLTKNSKEIQIGGLRPKNVPTSMHNMDTSMDKTVGLI